MILDCTTRAAEPDITIFELKGRLTLGTRLTEIEWAIRTAIQGGCRKLVLDLEHLDFIDSAGLGMLVMCAGLMSQCQGRLCVAAATPRVAQVFEVTNLELMVALHPTADSACRSLAEDAAAAG